MRGIYLTVPYILIGILLLGISGCSKFLEEKPTSFLSPGEFFTNPEDAEAGVIGCYNYLDGTSLKAGLFGTYQDWIFQIISDNFKVRPAGTANNTIGVGNYESFNSTQVLLNNVYGLYIGGLNSYATTIDNIESMDDFSDKKSLIAEAKFLQGYSYFILVQLYGPVTLIEHGINSEKDAEDLPRSDIGSIYNLIKDDFLYGMENLKSNAKAPGRATKWAAMGYLSKVYMILNEWDKAADLAKQIIDSGPYKLLENYEDVFKEENENNEESIFEIQHSSTANVANQVANWPRGIGKSGLDQNFLGPTWGGLYVATDDLLNAFEPNDKRRELIDTMVFKDDGTKVEFNADGLEPWYPLKRVPSSYINGLVANNAAGLNFIDLRLGDIYLVAAEAENEANGPNEAYRYINKVRERAGLPSLVAGLSQVQFREAVRNERRTELWDEGGKRYFDLLRWGTLIESVKKARPNVSIQPHNILWPLPQGALDRNSKLVQNPGY